MVNIFTIYLYIFQMYGHLLSCLFKYVKTLFKLINSNKFLPFYEGDSKISISQLVFGNDS